jgi:quercetin 2,3-dioxygenase
MKTIIHKANTRGHFNYGWLDTYHTFSFARYYDPERLNFGALRVLNDDIIKPDTGFGKHPHDNMEIISIPLIGKLKHKDSMGHEEVINTGEVQVMSAGTGIFHEEYNGSTKDDVNLLQIWIHPNKNNVTPRYDQKLFNAEDALNKWQEIVSNQNGETLMINQNAKISRVFLSEGQEIYYSLNKDSFGCYIFNVSGNITVENIELSDRDGLGVYETEKIKIKANSDAYLINLEVPE